MLSDLGAKGGVRADAFGCTGAERQSNCAAGGARLRGEGSQRSAGRRARRRGEAPLVAGAWPPRCKATRSWQGAGA